MSKYMMKAAVTARSMTRQEYVKYRYPKSSVNLAAGGPEDDGYLVEYSNGFQTWMEKLQFECAFYLLKGDRPSAAGEQPLSI